MRCTVDFIAYAEGAGMGASEDDDSDFVRRASAVFASELFKPMLQRATLAPGDVRALIADFREKLDALDTVIAMCSDLDSAGPRASVAAAGAGSGPPGMNGRGPLASVGDEHRDGLDEVGRNQRSRLRELAMLEALSREARPYALQQITAALEARGFEDTSGAVVSQLHRLKKLGIIDQPANGMYAITDQGLGHLRRMRSSFGSLLGGA